MKYNHITIIRRTINIALKTGYTMRKITHLVMKIKTHGRNKLVTFTFSHT